jgi:hypothetical protein
MAILYQGRYALVPKLITIQHPEETAHQAREYVKTYILMPSGLVGMFCLVVGVGGLGYQLIASDSYTWDTFYYSSGLIALGVMIGTANTQYHLYLFRHFPDVLAARMRRGPGMQRGKAKKDAKTPTIDHPGRPLLPLAYLVGIAALLGSSVAATNYGQVNAVPAVMMPWAGFYWAKLFFWRHVIKK